MEYLTYEKFSYILYVLNAYIGGKKMQKLELQDVSIDGRDWRQFRKSATQDELFILGIGTKYRVAKTRWLMLVCLAGMVASITIGVALIPESAGFIILVAGYLVSAFFATKYIRYNDSLSKIKWVLNKEYRVQLNAVLRSNGFAELVFSLLGLLVMFITIPYQAIMLLIGAFAPKFAIAKNGVLIALPAGCDIGGLASASAYYAQLSLIDELNQNAYEESHRYTATIRDEMSNEIELYSSNGIEYRDDSGHHYTSDDNGQTFTQID